MTKEPRCRLGSYFNGPYLMGHAFEPGGGYTPSFDHAIGTETIEWRSGSDKITVWSYALDMRRSGGRSRPMVFYHYTDRRGFADACTGQLQFPHPSASSTAEPYHAEAGPCFASREPANLGTHSHTSVERPDRICPDTGSTKASRWTCLTMFCVPIIVSEELIAPSPRSNSNAWQIRLTSCADFRGRLGIDRSIDICRQRVSLLHDIGGSESLVSMGSLVSMLSSAGQLEEASHVGTHVVILRRSTLGSGHPETQQSILRLAAIERARGHLAEAELLYREGLNACRARAGPCNAETLEVAENLAQVVRDQGSFEKAEPLCRAVLASRRRELGGAHPDTLRSLSNLAFLLRATGREDEAEPLCREALAGRRATLGSEHPDTLLSTNNLATLLHLMGRPEDAQPLYEQALAGFRQMFGDTHPDTFRTMSNLAAVLRDKGQLDKAEPLYREALAGRRALLGDLDVDTLMSARSLRACWQQQAGLRRHCRYKRKPWWASSTFLAAATPRAWKASDSLASFCGPWARLRRPFLCTRSSSPAPGRNWAPRTLPQ